MTMNLFSLKSSGHCHWIYLYSEKMRQSYAIMGIWSRFGNSVIIFNKFMPCLTIAGKSAFSKNNGSIAIIDAGLTDACCTEEW